MYYWEGVEEPGETLWQAILEENKKSRDERYTILGKTAIKESEDHYDFLMSEAADADYKEYLESNGYTQEEEGVHQCPNCHHRGRSREEWAEEQANFNSEFYWQNLGEQFDNINDDHEVAKYYGLNPEPYGFLDNNGNQRDIYKWMLEVKDGDHILWEDCDGDEIVCRVLKVYPDPDWMLDLQPLTQRDKFEEDVVEDFEMGLLEDSKVKILKPIEAVPYAL